MFTPEEREALRACLLDVARADPRVTGGAITGSASLGNEDRWSDIDLAFGVDGELAPVLADFTARMYREHGAIHHVDVGAGEWIYRVFLLASTLQVDLAFSPKLYARAPSFSLVFGSAAEPAHRQPPPAEELIGMAWLYSLHVRSSLARGRVWQAQYMLAGTRDYVLKLACLRHGLPVEYGRGIDRLPADVLDPLRASFVASVEPAELAHAFAVMIDALLREVAAADAALGSRLRTALEALRP